MEKTRSLSPIISEEDFLPLVEEKSRDFLSILNVLTDEKVAVNSVYYFTLMHEADKLESFLDDYGARTNLRWLFFSELVACVRNFALAGFQIYHILNRYPDYIGKEGDQLLKEFQIRSYDELEYFSLVLRGFYEAMVEEIKSLGAQVSINPIDKGTWGFKVTPQLPYTITGELASNEEERIVSLAQEYRKTVKYFRQNGLDRKIKATSLTEIIPAKINENLMAEMEIRLHNLQSEYDTYIRGGAQEKENAEVASIRGLTAIPMHLFEALKWLVHFYERHENEIRKNDVTAKIPALAQNEKLLSCIVDYCLHYCAKYLNQGNQVAENILSSFVKPITYELPIPRPHGFHARPATYITLIAQEHGTEVNMIVNGERFDCRSVLELLQAGGMLADLKDQTVIVEGDKRTLDDLKILADHNYCEDQDIPQELSYIRIMRNL
ncbi:hypothetical protein MNBD_NITROSPINAE02-2189 [hydrothermal vent metagenome]|uniref:Uncharacterized protein n=1 Tax=hydrothermal vent metagenome TaxID=652676 RepID=A0A3B1BPL9_9ZZZZ